MQFGAARQSDRGDLAPFLEQLVDLLGPLVEVVFQGARRVRSSISRAADERFQLDRSPAAPEHPPVESVRFADVAANRANRAVASRRVYGVRGEGRREA